MNSRNNNYLIEPARPEDGAELLQLLERLPYPGRVSLIYTRRPDAYQSFYKEGEEVRLFVCRDLKKGCIAGLGATAISDVYINKESHRVAYLFGLKLAPEYQKRFYLLPECYAHVREYLSRKKVDYTFTTILSGNEQARYLLEKDRKVMPSYEPYGRYETYALRNQFRNATSYDKKVRQANKNDIPQLVRFLNREAQKHNFFPVSRARDWTGIIDNNLTIDSVYVMEEGEEIIAVGAVWDQSSYKQYLVSGYSGTLKLVASCPWLAKLLGLPTLPSVGEIVPFYTLSRWAIKDNNPKIFDDFLNQIMTRTTRFPLCLVGVHENHPLRPRLEMRKHIRYDSHVYLVNWDKHQSSVEAFEPQAVYLECGAL